MDFLFILYYVGVFIFMIHLMNMLIAIMGNTFAIRNEVISEVKCQDHLQFVIDNWFLLEWAYRDLNKLNYIVAAISQVQNEEDENEAIEETKNSLGEKMNLLIDGQLRNHQKMREINVTVQNLMRLQAMGPTQFAKVRNLMNGSKVWKQ